MIFTCLLPHVKKLKGELEYVGFISSNEITRKILIL